MLSQSNCQYSCRHFRHYFHFTFPRHIEASLGALATQINFFIHNIAQWKFSSSGGSMGLLSFSPNSYSIATDGKIQYINVVAYHKRFYPESFYVSLWVLFVTSVSRLFRRHRCMRLRWVDMIPPYRLRPSSDDIENLMSCMQSCPSCSQQSHSPSYQGRFTSPGSHTLNR